MINRKVSPHDGRHTFNTILEKKGFPEGLRQAWLGHASPETTRRYRQINGTHLEQELTASRMFEVLVEICRELDPDRDWEGEVEERLKAKKRVAV